MFKCFKPDKSAHEFIAAQKERKELLWGGGQTGPAVSAYLPAKSPGCLQWVKPKAMVLIPCMLLTCIHECIPMFCR